MYTLYALSEVNVVTREETCTRPHVCVATTVGEGVIRGRRDPPYHTNAWEYFTITVRPAESGSRGSSPLNRSVLSPSL